MRPCIVALILVSLMLTASSAAMADWVDHFNGDFDEVWETAYFPNPGGDLSEFDIQIVSNALELKDPVVVGAGGAPVGYAYVDKPFTDAYVYGTLNPNHDSDMNAQVGLFLRGDGANAYALGVNYLTGAVEMVKNSATGQETLGEAGSISGLQAADSLYAEFYAFGTTLTGLIYDQVGGTLLESLIRTDSSYSAGVAGVFVQYGNPASALRGTFDDVGANTPEPASLVLLGSGGICGLGLWWRKRRRGKA